MFCIYGTQQNIGLTFRGARFGFDTAFVGTIEPKMGGRAPPSAASLLSALATRFTEWDHHLPETYGATPTNELTSKHYGATPTNELTI